jgi:peptide/nickel transport system ATP-binding protein
MNEVTSAPPTTPLLEVRDLAVSFGRGAHVVEAVRTASFTIGRGESVGLVGESGSGKTVTSLAIMGLVDLLGGHVTHGDVRFDGRSLVGLDPAEWRRIRGRHISMVFQQPVRSLNPALKVGEQIAETIRAHERISRRDAWARAVDLLDRVRIARPAQRAHAFPHQLSGGMCQRVMIAIAVACQPDLIIADEPTTALDVTVQAQILRLMRELIDESGTSLLYISHDLAVISEICSRVTVMYAGETIESGPRADVLSAPRHPYTSGLLQCAPEIGSGRQRLPVIPGMVPSPDRMPPGCRFAPRCPHAERGRCDLEFEQHWDPGLEHATRCIRSAELQLVGR